MSVVGVVEAADPVILTDAAIEKIAALAEDEGNESLKLRVYVTGGGCAGFQYGFSFEEDQAEDDTLVQKGRSGVLIDSMSIQYLAGSTIDYLEGLEGARFVVNNPHAQTTCGCGASFSI